MGIIAGHHRPALRRAAGGRPSSTKIALFCNVKPDCVIENMTIPVLYEAPLMLEKNRLLRRLSAASCASTRPRRI